MSGSKRWSRAAVPLVFALVVTIAGACEWPLPDEAPPTRSYIVGLRDDVSTDAVANERESRHGTRIHGRWHRALAGFSASMSEAEARDLSNDARVAFVEPDAVVHTMAQTTPTGVARIGAPANPNLRINGSADGLVDADVAVIDTGIDLSNPDLNVVRGVTCSWGSCTPGGNDDNHHGTHVAGTIGAKDDGNGVVGVAPGARLWAVKVLDASGSGYMSDIVSGLDWVAANAGEIEVANLSLGGTNSTALNNAVTNLVNRGVVVVVAAGNNASNAASTSPANNPDAITVSALADYNGAPGGGASPTCNNQGPDDSLASFSNYGAVVDIVAPGVCILSTWSGGGLAQLSGTSMATPHVSGAAALLASRSKPRSRADVLAVASTLKANGNSNWTDRAPDGIKEPVLDVSNASVFAPVLVGATTPPTTTPPTTTPPTTTPPTTTSPTTTPPTTTSPTTTSPTTTPPAASLTLTGTGSLLFGFLRIANLSWTGGNGASVTVYRGSAVAGTTTSASYLDINGIGAGTVNYRACITGTSTCSTTVTVQF